MFPEGSIQATTPGSAVDDDEAIHAVVPMTCTQNGMSSGRPKSVAWGGGAGRKDLMEPLRRAGTRT
jgi:hypothetical protein